jgi:uncharacterized Zn finger protein
MFERSVDLSCPHCGRQNPVALVLLVRASEFVLRCTYCNGEIAVHGKTAALPVKHLAVS